ncbi:hypothetical protein QJQ45_028791 [Haematococcus lacustris]|nr:hypothetical protein QJQ45_028791 [Haematococcus lacustris]
MPRSYCACCSEYQQAFGVVVCVHCLRDTHYQLIPKGTAKELFLLSDGDLKRLGCITKANPQHKQWSGMKLYLKLQVAEVAQRKHGGAQSLQEARHSRLQGRIASRVAKRKAAATAESEEGDDAENPLFGIQDAAAAANPKVAEARQRVRQRLQTEYGGAGTAARKNVDQFEGDPGSEVAKVAGCKTEDGCAASRGDSAANPSQLLLPEVEEF